MTLHKGIGKLRCHYCDYVIPRPSHCSSCLSSETTSIDDEKKAEDYGLLAERGGGTEKIVEEVERLFPHAKILRMDRDTTGTKDSYGMILSAMKDKSSDILIGTQMIAKGHDIPGVTLVGIIDADTGIHIPDFRSHERTFQLLTQVSGRAGRGEEIGRVILQTRQPTHPAIVATVTNKFLAFAQFEIKKREEYQYPPCGKLLRIVISHENSIDAGQAATIIKEISEQMLGSLNEDASILGPSRCPLEKIRGLYRYHVFIKSQSPSILSRLVRELRRWKDQNKELKYHRVTFDIDPVEMM